MTKKSNTNKPAESLRDGAVKATIWRNQSESGVFFTVDFSRTYKGADGNYHDSHSFSGTQLLQLAQLAQTTYRRVGELRQAENTSADEESAS